MSAESLADAFLSCRRRLAQVVARIVPPQDIEDIVHETYVRVCEYATKSRIIEARGLMVTVARNLAFDHVKRSEYRLTRRFGDDSEIEALMAEDATDESFDKVATHQEFSQFCDALRQLPVQCRRVFVLKKVYGYSQKEIALELRISENTVEKHIATGLQQCIRYMRVETQSKNNPPPSQEPKAGPRGSL